MHRPVAVSMFAAGFVLICEKVQAFRVKIGDIQTSIPLVSQFLKNILFHSGPPFFLIDVLKFPDSYTLIP